MPQGHTRRGHPPARILAVLLAAALAAMPAPARAGPEEQDQCDPIAGVVYVPAQGTNGALFFEDKWPIDGDLDFNDQIISYSYEFLLDSVHRVVALKATYNLLAVGAEFHNGLYLHLPIAASTVSYAVDQDGNPVQNLDGELEMVLPVVADTRDLFTQPAQPEQFINTVANLPVLTGRPVGVTITFLHGVDLAYALAPFDLFIARSDDFSFQIHLPQFPGTDQMNTALFHTGMDHSTDSIHFINEHGLPFAIALPEVIAWPQETVPLDSIYPGLDAFAESGGTENPDWYKTGILLSQAYLHGEDDQKPPVPLPVQPDLVCNPLPPDIGYWQEQANCTLNQPCSIEGPGNQGGGAIAYSISPPLPEGLSMEPIAGAISGVATALGAPVTYTVTAVNTGGGSSTTLRIAIVDQWPSSLVYPPSWSLQCVLGVFCATLPPTTQGGKITHYEIDPALPAGLSIDPTTGVVGGVPIETHPYGYGYRVTASNSGGFVTSYISVEVDAAP